MWGVWRKYQKINSCVQSNPGCRQAKRHLWQGFLHGEANLFLTIRLRGREAAMLESSMLDDANFDPTQRDLLQITWRMLEAINTGDAGTYASLSAPDLSCYEDV